MPQVDLSRCAFYSPLSFCRAELPSLARAFAEQLQRDVEAGEVEVHEPQVAPLYVRHLPWDSEHFGCATYRLEYGGGEANATQLGQALTRLREQLRRRHGRYYLSAEVPCEDPPMLQALGLGGMRLIETRATYFRRPPSAFEWPERYAVRSAGLEDIAGLRQVAATQRNAYDRVHADPFFTQQQADDYLASFVDNSVRGFATRVVVPHDSAPPDAFFTVKVQDSAPATAGLSHGRIVLVAVGAQRRGWHHRLLVETTRWLGTLGVEVAHMTTQATNRAVIYNCERLGYRFGRATHLFA